MCIIKIYPKKIENINIKNIKRERRYIHYLLILDKQMACLKYFCCLNL